QLCQVNRVPLIDEYLVDIYEDELDRDNHSLHDPDEDNETNEAVIKAFSSSNDQAVEDEIQQVSKSQVLSPREFQHDNFHLKNQDINTVIAGRTNTRLFSSRSSQ
ncbi:hypothetical protein EJD97_018741, partial [Solanum chilense]